MPLEDLESFLYKQESIKKKPLEDKSSNLFKEQSLDKQKIDPNRESILQDGAIKKSESLEKKNTTLTDGSISKGGPIDKKTSIFYKKEQILRQDLGKKTSLFSNADISQRRPFVDISRKGSFYKPFNLGVSGIFSTYPSVSGGSSNILTDSKTAAAGGSLTAITPPNSDSNTVQAPAIYELQVGLKINALSSDIINIVYSKDNGVTWKSFYNYYELQYNAPVGGVSVIGTRGAVTVNQGSDVWIALEDYYTEAGIVFGVGEFSGEFSSLCGRSNPYKLTNISTLGKVFRAYVNLNIQGSSIVLCGPDADDYYYGDDTVNGYHDTGYFAES